MYYIKHFLSIIIMFIIPYFVYTGLDIFFFGLKGRYHYERNILQDRLNRSLQDKEDENNKLQKIIFGEFMLEE